VRARPRTAHEERPGDVASSCKDSHLRATSRPFTFISPWGFHTQRLARTLDSLVRVSRRVDRDHIRSESLAPRPAPRAGVGSFESHKPGLILFYLLPHPFSRHQPILTLLAPHTSSHRHAQPAKTRTPAEARKQPFKQTAQAASECCDNPIQQSLSLYSQQFQVLLTLFSKSFSPFPYGTCVLSVYPRYLALDGIYHPFKAVVPNNPTLGEQLVHGGHSVEDGVLTLCDAAFQQTWTKATR